MVASIFATQQPSFRPIPGLSWILQFGEWDDLGVWMDTAVWEDS